MVAHQLNATGPSSLQNPVVWHKCDLDVFNEPDHNSSKAFPKVSVRMPNKVTRIGVTFE